MDIDVKKIRLRRAHAEITLKELSEGTGITIALLSRYENGKTKPGMCNLLKIDKYLRGRGV